MSDDSDQEMHLRLAPVVDLPCVTRHDIEVDKVLNGAVGKLKSVVVIGWEDDGPFYFASNHADGGTVLWLLELARIKLLKAGGA